MVTPENLLDHYAHHACDVHFLEIELIFMTDLYLFQLLCNNVRGVSNKKPFMQQSNILPKRVLIFANNATNGAQ